MVTLEQEILNTIEEVKRLPIEKRPALIKMRENKKFKDLKSEVNQVLQNMEIMDLDLDQLNIFHYGSALYIQRQIAPWYDESKPYRIRNKNNKVPKWKQKITKTRE